MITNKIGNIVVQTAGRKSSHFGKPHTVNTTARFGEVQPVQCVKLVPHSSYKCNSSTVIRALPLVAPVTSGLIKAKVWHKFVGLSDLLQKWPSYLTSAPMGSVQGSFVLQHPPMSTLQQLSFGCLIGCKVSCYVLDTSAQTSSSIALSVDSATSKWVALKSISAQHVLQTIQDYENSVLPSGMHAFSRQFSQVDVDFNSRFAGYLNASDNWSFVLNLLSPVFPFRFVPTFNQSSFLGSWFAGQPRSVNVDIRTADFVFTRVFDAGTRTGLGIDPVDSKLKVAFAVQMSDIGLRWYKTLVGLGYKPDFASTDPIEITRLFAYYKAYFDSFGITYWTNYESTNAYNLLQWFDQNMLSVPLRWEYDLTGESQTSSNLFVRFIQDVANSYVTEPLDYISAHRESDISSPSQANGGFLDNIVVAGPNVSQTHGAFDTSANDVSSAPIFSPNMNATRSIFINKVNHTQVDADLLKILYRSVNVQTVAGKRLEELLRAGGYGEWVNSQHSSFIGMDEIELDITDINATADSTNSVTGKNSTLGETVGKGLAISSPKKDSFHSYENEEVGYWISIMAFIPESSYVQGVDQTIYDTDKFDEFNPDYDSVGYELQRKSVVAAGGDWFSVVQNSRSPSDDSFGVIPRLTRYKVAQSIVNGGFLRRSERDYFLNYCLDRFIHFNDRVESAEPDETGNDGTVYTLSRYADVSQLPIAGIAWRYVNRYPWLASFERIFTYIGDAYAVGGLTQFGQSGVEARWLYCSFGEDGFMFFTRFLAEQNAPMLPLEKSWSTTDEPGQDGKLMRQA